MLFRIAQEAISNVLRHANASKVSIRLWTADAHLWLEIKDDGCGFDIEEMSEEAVDRKQLGLLGIEERVSLVGGAVKVESARGAGTRLQLHIPLPVEDSMSSEPNPLNMSEGTV